MRSDLEYATRLVEQCKGKLFDSFSDWYAPSFPPQIVIMSPPPICIFHILLNVFEYIFLSNINPPGTTWLTLTHKPCHRKRPPMP